MLRGKILVVCLLLSITIFAGSAFALSPGTPFSFIDVVLPGSTNTWTHSITNFAPPLSGSEPLIINSGNLFLNLTFTPEWFPLVGGGGFYLFDRTPDLDGYDIGNTFIYGTTTPGQVTTSWLTPITSQFALNAIADKQAQIILRSGHGTLNNVTYSGLWGKGVVGPEPISMVLVGVGIAGLPVAGRIRRFIKKG